MRLPSLGTEVVADTSDTAGRASLARPAYFQFVKALWQFATAGLFLLPALIPLAVFTLWPIIWVIWASFHAPAGREWVPVGLTNYLRFFSDPIGQRVLTNTICYVSLALVVSVIGGLLLALLLNEPIRGMNIWRFPFLAPIALPMVSVASIWLFLYAPEIGLLNAITRSVGLPRVNWLGDPNTALPAIFIVYVWKQIGYFALFYLAGLQALPDDVMDAAKLDGAERWSKLRYILWPLVSPTTYFVSTIATLNALQLIDHIFMLTAGGPNNMTNMALYYVYEQAFKFFKTGPASAVTVLLLAVLLTLAIIQYVFLERRVHYE
ncbi:MAG: sugar ABC transporter permease [Chloroflexi bacterium]|nr:sugar ABC transporter permease [Chloroflexota bacterium]